jgi:hypothetical protein
MEVAVEVAAVVAVEQGVVNQEALWLLGAAASRSDGDV